ncbi:MAG: hypothetical protein Q8K63_15340 [Acidimicrobiales bacterium]|nr:hypothetical protein [Acidimicrobiales bacterium]
MGYRGKVAEREKARELRADGMTLVDIAAELGVAKGSVSVWVRDVPFTPSKRRYGPRVRPNALMQRKQAEIDRGIEQGRERVGELSEKEFLVAGAALYAGEGAKRDGMVVFPNSDARLVAFFAAWLRRFFTITSHVCACGCTSTTGSTSTRRSHIGSKSPESPEPSFISRTEPRRTHRFVPASMNLGVRQSNTRVRGRTVKSWVWCMAC